MQFFWEGSLEGGGGGLGGRFGGGSELVKAGWKGRGAARAEGGVGAKEWRELRGVYRVVCVADGSVGVGRGRRMERVEAWEEGVAGGEMRRVFGGEGAGAVEAWEEGVARGGDWGRRKVVAVGEGGGAGRGVGARLAGGRDKRTISDKISVFGGSGRGGAGRSVGTRQAGAGDKRTISNKISGEAGRRGSVRRERAGPGRSVGKSVAGLQTLRQARERRKGTRWLDWEGGRAWVAGPELFGAVGSVGTGVQIGGAFN
ncbi:hypothetical protein DFH06DRAFT_1145739 [Mycena polygramma]|nr:hypothetical protein DFH06DRAFT_1145739 [Mycena polygramma]